MGLLRYLSFLDLASYRFQAFRRDLIASATVTFLDIPQGVAYAMIAGLPPAMGLYAAAVPAIAGALFRSSRHVVTGPTNALSLLVGSAVAGAAARSGASPLEVGVTLAFFVGLMQFFAGLLRLDAVADYISLPVVRGYITGAAVLIAVGQLPNVTGTTGSSGTLGHMLVAWSRDLSRTNPLAVTFACGTVIVVLLLRWVDRRIPGALIVMVVSIGADGMLHLQAHGLRVVADIAPVPAGLPPLTVPQLAYWEMLTSAAVACAVLSLVESSSVARALAARTGQQLDLAAEFIGQGLANLATAFSGGYPVSGSLSRSALNQQAGAVSRLSALFCGLLMLAVLLVFGPVVGRTPVASLAGLLLVLANDLVDRQRIRMTLRGTTSDRAAFVATTLGTWVLPLDQAIYAGVGISLILFLRRARLLTIREMAISEKGRFREVDPESNETGRTCAAIRIMNLTGSLFFAAAGELQSLLDRFLDDGGLRVLILRLRQAETFDVTTASVLEEIGGGLTKEGKTLLLLGVRPATLQLLERTGVAERLGRTTLFPTQTGWFTAMELALRRALTLTGAHQCGGQCPLAEYVAAQEVLRATAKTL